MKVSKKCIRKMKNRPFLLGKMRSIWVWAFLVASFLCSSVLGTSVSAVNTSKYPSKVYIVSSANTSLFVPVTFNSDYYSPYFTLSSGESLVGMRFDMAGSYDVGQRFLVMYTISCRVPLVSSGTNISSDTGSCTPGGVALSLTNDNMAITDYSITPSNHVYQSYNTGADAANTTSYSDLYSYNVVIYGYFKSDVSGTASNPFQMSFGGPLLLHNTSGSVYYYFTRPHVILYDEPDSAADAIRDQGEQEKSETNAQVQAGDSASNSSSSDASSQGSTLLSAFQSFIGALTSASPSNCNLDMDLGNLDLGNANLCSISPPPAFQVVSSIVLIGFCVPLSIATAKKLVSLFRSFQS